MTNWHPIPYMVVAGIMFGGVLSALYLLVLAALFGAFSLDGIAIVVIVGIGAGAIMGFVEGAVIAWLLNGNRLNDVRSLDVINGVITTIVGIIIAKISLGNFLTIGASIGLGVEILINIPIALAIAIATAVAASVWATRHYVIHNPHKRKRKEKIAN